MNIGGKSKLHKYAKLSLIMNNLQQVCKHVKFSDLLQLTNEIFVYLLYIYISLDNERF